MWFYFLCNHKPWKHQQNHMKGTFPTLYFPITVRFVLWVELQLLFFYPRCLIFFNSSCCYSAHDSVFLETKMIKHMFYLRGTERFSDIWLTTKHFYLTALKRCLLTLASVKGTKIFAQAWSAEMNSKLSRNMKLDMDLFL